MISLPAYHSYNTMTIHRIIAGLLLALSLTACSGDGDTPPNRSLAVSGSTIRSSNLEADGSPPETYSDEDYKQGLKCDPLGNLSKDPVLLVHGTFTYGQQNYGATLAPLLRERGWAVCIVTYPNRGFDDIQRTSEFVAYAVEKIAAESNRKVALIGHSQGVMQARWAAKWWPNVQNNVSDLISLAGPNQGIILPTAPRQALALLGIKNASFPAAFYQFTQNSDFIRALNRDDETPGDIDYTVLYTQFDELIQPAAPFPAGALEFGQNNPKRINILLQDICPGRVVEHISIAFFDKLSLELVFDALSHDGPADVDRAGGKNLCGLPVLGSFAFAEDAATLALDAFVISNFPQGLPGLGLSPGEPPLMDYAK